MTILLTALLQAAANTYQKRITITFDGETKSFDPQPKPIVRNISGYILIKQYPGINKPLGYFEKYTTGEYNRYPEFWKPVYLD